MEALEKPLGDGPPRRAPQTTASWPREKTHCRGCSGAIVYWVPPKWHHGARHWRSPIFCATCTAMHFAPRAPR